MPRLDNWLIEFVILSSICQGNKKKSPNSIAFIIIIVSIHRSARAIVYIVLSLLPVPPPNL